VGDDELGLNLGLEAVIDSAKMGLARLELQRYSVKWMHEHSARRGTPLPVLIWIRCFTCIFNAEVWDSSLFPTTIEAWSLTLKGA